MKVEFYKHNLGQEDLEQVGRVIKSTFLTCGPVTAEFEEKFAQYLGVKYVVGVSNATAGLFLALRALGIGPDDEVITTPMTFIATPNAVLHAGAKPVFVDVEPKTGNLDASRIEAAITPKTKAILPVHLYGQMCDMKAIRRIADKHGLKVIEDAAHCVAGRRDGLGPGQAGDAAVFSFYATKELTSGEGGAVATNDEGVASTIRLLRSHGMDRAAAERYVGRFRHWDMVALGYNFTMFDIQAALLIKQLDRLADYHKTREQICERYEQGLSGMAGISWPSVAPNSRSARHLFTVWVPAKTRDELLDQLQEKGIGVAVNYRAVPLLKYYRERFGFSDNGFPVAEDIGKRTISLPLHCQLTDKEIGFVIDTLKDGLKTVLNRNTG